MLNWLHERRSFRRERSDPIWFALRAVISTDLAHLIRSPLKFGIQRAFLVDLESLARWTCALFDSAAQPYIDSP